MVGGECIQWRLPGWEYVGCVSFVEWFEVDSGSDSDFEVDSGSDSGTGPDSDSDSEHDSEHDSGNDSGNDSEHDSESESAQKKSGLNRDKRQPRSRHAPPSQSYPRFSIQFPRLCVSLSQLFWICRRVRGRSIRFLPLIGGPRG